MTTIRVAVIGAGHLGLIHTRLLAGQKNVEVVGVADPTPTARQRIATEFSLPCVEDYRALIPHIDAAVIATPTRTHFEIASELIQSRKHLLIEKPLTDSLTDAEALVNLADRFRSVIQVGHVERFNPAFKEALAHVGQPKFVIGNRLSSYTFRSTDIGVVHDLMIHDIDLVNGLFPGSVVETRAAGISLFGGHEDIAQAYIQFNCGGIANLTASRCSYQNDRSMQIFGTNGFASIDLTNNKVTVVSLPDQILHRKLSFQTLTETEQAFVRANLFETILPKREIQVDKTNAILHEQEDWLNAIRFGEMPTVTAKIGCEAVEIAESVLTSIASHRWSTHDAATTGPFGLIPSVPAPLQAAPTIRRAA